MEHLARRFEEKGGMRYNFLTHRDDVADADKDAKRFGANRIINRLELSSQPDAERVIVALAPQELEPGFPPIPTPSHTRGHCLLAGELFVFSGDHIWWSRNRDRLTVSRSICPEYFRRHTRFSEFAPQPVRLGGTVGMVRHMQNQERRAKCNQ